MTAITQIANGDSGSATRSKLNKLVTRVVDVKMAPYNATGDGTTDDTTAIQAAVNWASTGERSVIFFPPGTYKVTAPITFNYNSGDFGIKFEGVGRASKIFGNFDGFIFDRDLGATFNPGGGIKVFENLWITNAFELNGGAIRLGSSIGSSIRDCVISADQGVWFVQASDPDTGSQSQTIINCTIGNGSGIVQTGTNGVIMGGNGAIIGCDQSGHDVAYRMYGVGFNIIGGRCEGNNTGVMLAKGTDGAAPDSGCSGFTIQGTSFEANGVAIDFANGAGHGALLGLNILAQEGAAPNSTNPQYGIKSVDTASMVLIAGCNVSGKFEQAAVKVGDNGTGGVVLAGVNVANSSTLGGVPWIMPAFARSAQFIGCNKIPIYAIANLPASPIEGEEYNTYCDTAVWGATATASGPNHVLVRYNGSRWTVVGK